MKLTVFRLSGHSKPMKPEQMKVVFMCNYQPPATEAPMVLLYWRRQVDNHQVSMKGILYTIPNGHHPKWTPSQMDTIPNGHHPEWTPSLNLKVLCF